MALDALVEIRDLNFSGERPILKGINMDMHRGQVIAIMGGSGSGKTTLLRLIGAQFASSGYVKLEGNVDFR